jgi:hypothetical protein
MFSFSKPETRDKGEVLREQVRGWQRELKQEMRGVDKSIRGEFS